jgi:hypothetical protein
VLFERLGKSRRRLVANAGRNPGDSVVARFEHERGLVHPTRDKVTVHGLADDLKSALTGALSSQAPTLIEVPTAAEGF